MSIPLPNLPVGAIQITFQANIEGYEPTVRVLAPRMTAKIQQYLAESLRPSIVDNVVAMVPLYPGGMTQVLEEMLDKHLLSMLDARYPDPPDTTVADLEAQLAAAKAAVIVQPKFIEQE